MNIVGYASRKLKRLAHIKIIQKQALKCQRTQIIMTWTFHGAGGLIVTLHLFTHLVTVEILTPNTPMGFSEGILFRLNSLLVNFMDSLISI